MGFRPERKRVRITFEPAHDLHGLEMVTSSVPIDTVMTVMRAAGAGKVGGPPDAAAVESVQALFQQFGEALIEWNLEHPVTGEPVDPSADGLRGLDFDLVTRLAMEWIDALLGAAAPLGTPSSSGPRFPVASIPMASLSASQAS